MYSDVVMEKAAGIEPNEGEGIRQKLEHHLSSYKSENNLLSDTDLGEKDWENVIEIFKNIFFNINYKEVQIDWDHDNIGNCLECLTEVGIEEVK